MKTLLPLLVMLDLPTAAWAHGGAAERTADAPGHATEIDLGTVHAGELVVGASVETGDALEIEVRLARMVAPPDPLLGAVVPVPSATVSVSVLRGKTVVAGPLSANPDGPAGQYLAETTALPAGPYTVRVSVVDGASTDADYALVVPEHEMAGAKAAGNEGHTAMTGHHAMTHPFLSHMGIPDAPGEVGVRVTMIERANGAANGEDLALHIEAGIAPRLGLHLRNDTITGNALGEAGHGSELMLMYALAQDEEATRGVSVFAEVSAPTFAGDEPVGYGVGVGGRWMGGTRVLLDGIVHVEPMDAFSGVSFAYTVSAELRLAGRIFLLVEDNGEAGGMENTNYLLPSVKVGLGETGGAAGFGVQFPLTDERAYDRQLLFQLDWGF